MSSGLDDLERRGRWGRPAASASARSIPPPPALPAPSPPIQPTSTPAPKRRAATNRRAPARRPAPARQEPEEGVERVVIYLSKEQTAWIRERQIEALRAGKRISTSKLLRDLMDRAMS